MEIKDMILKTIVIGNGFDVDLKFKTKYSDFIESNEWKTIYQQRSKENSKYSLLQYLNGKRYIEEWFDIEASLLDYVSRRKDGSYVNNVEDDRHDYELICQTLEEYLKNEINNNEHFLDETCAGKLLKQYYNSCNNGNKNLFRFYSFNYTPVDFYCRILGSSTPSNDLFEYMHGEFEKKTSILGFEVDNINDIAPGYSFLIKSNNPNYKASGLSLDLMNSKEVIFFGHSFNVIDMGYFFEYFSMMESNADNDKGITIITYKEDSKQLLFDNLRKCGISVQKLFTHSNLKVIRTKNVENDPNGEDSVEFERLLNRI